MDCKFIFKESYYTGHTIDLVKRKQEIESFCAENGIVVQNIATLTKVNPFEILDSFAGMYQDIGKYADSKTNFNLLMLHYGQWIQPIPDVIATKADTVRYVKTYREIEHNNYE